MVAEAMADVPVISAGEAHRRMQQDPNTLFIDVRDAADIPATGIIPGAANISLGSLTYRADNEVPEEARDSRLSDRSRPIITVCERGPVGALGGKLLKDMGFTNVSILEGGTRGWKDAGFVTEPLRARER
jgi:rhodanese-related sulfurtransferase